MLQERLKYLLEKYKNESLTEDEAEELRELCGPSHENEVLNYIRHQMEAQESPLFHISEAELQALAAKIVAIDKPVERIDKMTKANKKGLRRMHYLRIVQWTAAAVILFVIGTVLFFRMNYVREQKIEKSSSQALTNDIQPGSNKAILSLANGQKIILDSMHNGQLAVQGKSQVMKVNSGLLAYNNSQPAAHNAPSATVQYNTLTTPRGGQYQLVLPDGTKVWLNAASSVTFPTAFIGKERIVEVTGETYFEVAKNSVMPFIVKTAKSEVQVLGTHFNINAYTDEPNTKITLLEGSVRIQPIKDNTQQEETGKQSLIILPDEQVQINDEGNVILSKDVDTSDVVAWKNGKFKFDNTGLIELMRQLSRWYNMTVIYSGNVKEYQDKYAFVGEIKRDSNLSLVLKLLELGGVHFKIQNKDLIVMP